MLKLVIVWTSRELFIEDVSQDDEAFFSEIVGAIWAMEVRVDVKYRLADNVCMEIRIKTQWNRYSAYHGDHEKFPFYVNFHNKENNLPELWPENL